MLTWLVYSTVSRASLRSSATLMTLDRDPELVEVV